MQSCSTKQFVCREVAHKMSRAFFYPMIKLMVQVSKEGTLATHRWVPFPKVYYYIVNFVRLVKKRGKVIEPMCCNCPQWIQGFLKYNPSNLQKEATEATPAMSRVLRVVTYHVKALYMAFLGTLGSICLSSCENPKRFISNKLSF